MMKTYTKKFDPLMATLRGGSRYWKFRNRVVEALKEYGDTFRIYPIYSADKDVLGLEVTVFGKTAKKKNLDKIMKEALLLEEAA